MTLTVHRDIDQRSEAWHELRRGIVTASVVGRLLTTKTQRVADNDDSRNLTAALVAERITGQVDPNYVSADMWRGIEHEPFALDAYAQHHAPVDTAVSFMVRNDPWPLGYSPDAIVGDDGLVEVKCPRAKTHLLTILEDAVPPQHMPQLQAGLLVSGRPWIDFVSFNAGMPLWVKRVHPDPQWHAAILAAVECFELEAAALLARYENATRHLPATERVPDLDLVI